MSIWVVQPLLLVYATVDGVWNTISWANSNYINLSNSWAYQVNFSLSGTLDANDTFLLTASDGSGNTATGSLTSASGWESSGSVSLNFNTSGWSEWQLSFSGEVYSGGITSQVVASGMLLTGTLDTTKPNMVLSSTGSSTITWSTLIHVTTSEAVTGFITGDISVTNGTISGFSQTSSTWYTFNLTPTISSGTVLASVWANISLDVAGNGNTASNVLSFNTTDTTAPIVTITSHASGSTITGSPTISGTMSDNVWVTSIMVNGWAATLGSWTWSKVISNLVGWANTITAIAIDLAGNTGSDSIILNRVSLSSSINTVLSGTTSAIITFNTDITATGVVNYGTNSGSLNLVATGTTSGTTHSFTLTGLLTDTIYYFVVQGQGGSQSSIMQFKTPTVINNNASWSIVATGSVYLSGSTGTGVTFLGSGSLTILSLLLNGSQISFPLNGLTITALWGNWNGVLQAPEITSNSINLALSGYAFTGTAYQIGNANNELIFSGQTVTVSVLIGASLSWQTVKVFRSTNWGTTYTELTTCIINSWWLCTFSTNQLSLFGFAIPADTVPNAFGFTAITGTELSTQYTSNTITVWGINGSTAVSIVGGEYSINSGVFTSANGIVNLWDTVVLRAVSSASFSTNTNTILTIGGVTGTYSITTRASTGGGGGGSTSGAGWPNGGGGGGISTDNCPGGDYSPNYYDGRCSVTWTWGNVIVTPPGMFSIPPIFITSISDINFRDIGNSWAKGYIIRLVVRGIINNVILYRPNDNLTRAEFLKIAIRTTGWTLPIVDLNIPFDDVRDNSWYAQYVSLALTKGMINGDANSFRPNYTITRAEATKIIMVALWVTISEPTALTFVDTNINSDLTKYIKAAAYLDILSGQVINGRKVFRPNDSITRAEIAKIVANAFHL